MKVFGVDVYVDAAKPKHDNKCDKDNTELVIRDDDNESVVRNRLEVYHRQTKPIVAYYEKESILKEIDADKSPDEVFSEVLEIVK